MDRFPVNRVESNSLFTASESDNQLMKVRNLAMGYGNTITNPCRAKFLSFLQSVDCPGLVDRQTAVDQNINQFRKNVLFGILRKVFAEIFVFKNLIQSHLFNLTL